MPVDLVGRVLPFAKIRYLNAADQVLDEMFTGWRRQQLSRNLTFGTIDGREKLVRRFLDHSGTMPWDWTVHHVDEFFGDLRSESHLRQSTTRAYQNALRLFCGYLVDPAYGWDTLCEREFGTHPSQVCFEWNTARHAQTNEQGPDKRAFTRAELQSFFDRADAEVARPHELGRKGQLAAFRDSVIFKTAYAYGLRRNEVRHLQTVDFGRNPHAPEFKRFGTLNVRWGKATSGSAPKRRSVLTVFSWTPDVISQWLTDGLPRLHPDGGPDVFPSERGTLVSEAALSARFRRYRDDLNLAPGLDFHSLRRSYVTHLLEAGMDAMFVQHQVGHEYASTTAIYTCVSSDYRTRTLRAALDSTIKEALATGGDDL